MLQPIISVVTVVRNDYAGIARTSLVMRPCVSASVEWIIVDGVSTDGSRSYAEGLQSDYIRFATREPRGIYDAMNYGASLATGEWLWFINAGDILLTQSSMNRALDVLPPDREVVLVATPVIYRTRQDLYFSVTAIPCPESTQPRVARVHHQGALIRRQAFNSLQGFRTDLRWSADGEFLDRLVGLGRTLSVDEPLVGFKMGGASMTNFRQALIETNTFRPGYYSRHSRVILTAKNRLITLMLVLECANFLRRPVTWYLLRRHDRVLRAYPSL